MKASSSDFCIVIGLLASLVVFYRLIVRFTGKFISLLRMIVSTLGRSLVFQE